MLGPAIDNDKDNVATLQRYSLDALSQMIKITPPKHKVDLLAIALHIYIGNRFLSLDVANEIHPSFFFDRDLDLSAAVHDVGPVCAGMHENDVTPNRK
jgi:hypothetical protein